MDHKILVYGYGNPGRQDDGAGVEVINKLEEWKQTIGIPNLSLDANYQLNIEDSAEMQDKDIVVFVDASLEEDVDGFICTRVKPSSKAEFTMHSVSPGFLLDLTQKIYNKDPKSYLVHIKGYEWEFQKEMTSKASENLDKAVAFIKQAIYKPELFHEATLKSSVDER